MKRNRLFKWCLALLAMTLTAHGAEGPVNDPKVFAIVGDVVLSAADFHTAYNAGARTRFYHSKPPQDEVAIFQREIGAELINRVLLVKEAKRRGMKPDAEQVKALRAAYEARASKSPNWSANKEKLLASMTEQFENQSLFEQLQKLTKSAPKATEEQARTYYNRNLERFVEPEQIRTSVILVKVDPSSPQKVWDAAREEATRIHKLLKSGGKFAELAAKHSGDMTASKGGDMGYVHRGMLPEQVHGVVDKLKNGEFSEPITLLEGVAILRLEDRKPPHQRKFEEVRERASDLWQREEIEGRWQKLITDLRKATPVRLNTSFYLPIESASGKKGS